jgi:hypothetical protein
VVELGRTILANRGLTVNTFDAVPALGSVAVIFAFTI